MKIVPIPANWDAWGEGGRKEVENSSNPRVPQMCINNEGNQQFSSVHGNISNWKNVQDGLLVHRPHHLCDAGFKVRDDHHHHRRHLLDHVQLPAAHPL